jgi:tetratricopeptide (TPR) repeat protein
VYGDRAFFRFLQKDYAAAIQDATEALSEPADSDYAYYLRGISHTLLKQYAQAQQDLLQAITLDPESGAALNALGWVYLLQGQTEQARSSFERGHLLLQELSGLSYFLEPLVPQLLAQLQLAPQEAQGIHALLAQIKQHDDKAALFSLQQYMLQWREQLQTTN